MRSNICSFFRSGHCKFKLSCSKSHDILTCRFGPSCPFIKSCNFRHPPLCENFLKNKCGFFQNGLFRASKSCSYFHFPSHYPPPSLVPHLGYPLPPPPLLPGEFGSLPGVNQRNTVMPATQNNTESAPVDSIVKNCESENLHQRSQEGRGGA